MNEQKPEPLTDERKAFEDAIFAEHFLRAVKIDPKRQFWDLSAQREKADLLKRDDESYADESIGAMWFGWNLRASSGEAASAPQGGEPDHELKCWPSPFAAMLAGDKTAEFRRTDRDYRVGQILRLNEWYEGYTGRFIDRLITHILPAPFFGMPEGFAMLSLRALAGAAPEPSKPLGQPAPESRIAQAGRLAMEAMYERREQQKPFDDPAVPLLREKRD